MLNLDSSRADASKMQVGQPRQEQNHHISIEIESPVVKRRVLNSTFNKTQIKGAEKVLPDVARSSCFEEYIKAKMDSKLPKHVSFRKFRPEASSV